MILRGWQFGTMSMNNCTKYVQKRHLNAKILNIALSVSWLNLYLSCWKAHKKTFKKKSLAKENPSAGWRTVCVRVCSPSYKFLINLSFDPLTSTVTFPASSASLLSSVPSWLTNWSGFIIVLLAVALYHAGPGNQISEPEAVLRI